MHLVWCSTACCFLHIITFVHGQITTLARSLKSILQHSPTKKFPEVSEHFPTLINNCKTLSYECPEQESNAVLPLAAACGHHVSWDISWVLWMQGSWSELLWRKEAWEVQVFLFISMRFSKNSEEITGFVLWWEHLLWVVDILCESQRPLLLKNMCFWQNRHRTLRRGNLKFWSRFSLGLYVLVGAGALMTTVGFFGCCGAARESQFLLGAVSESFKGLEVLWNDSKDSSVISGGTFAVQDLKCPLSFYGLIHHL